MVAALRSQLWQGFRHRVVVRVWSREALALLLSFRFVKVDARVVWVRVCQLPHHGPSLCGKCRRNMLTEILYFAVHNVW